jgi:hypothetical protein
VRGVRGLTDTLGLGVKRAAVAALFLFIVAYSFGEPISFLYLGVSPMEVTHITLSILIQRYIGDFSHSHTHEGYCHWIGHHREPVHSQ